MATATLPPGPRAPLPVRTVRWLSRPGPYLERCRARHGDVFTLRIANQPPWVMLGHPDAVREVFTGDPELLHAGEANRILLPVVGSRSVLLLDRAEHMAQRKLLLPPFHGRRMQRYSDLIREVAEREVARWRPGQALRLWPRMQEITLEVVMRAVFGIEQGDRLERLRALLRDMLDWTTDQRRLFLLVAIGPKRMTGLPAYRRARERVDALLYEEIARRRADPDLGERDDILAMLVQARGDDGRPMTDQELRDELITLLVAGHETTATSLAWAFERLVRHPGKLARLREEVLAGATGYRDAVVQETLRLRPVLAVVLRRLKAPMEIAGHALPAGVAVAPCIYLVHRHPDVHADPHAFRPERFLETPPGTYTWIPFGGGVRRCIGASFAQFEMATVLETVVRHADLRPVRREDEGIARRAITLTPRRGAEVLVARAG